MIKDPFHTHLNATRWTSLSEFLSHLAVGGEFAIKRENIAGVESEMIMIVDKQR